MAVNQENNEMTTNPGEEEAGDGIEIHTVDSDIELMAQRRAELEQESIATEDDPGAEGQEEEEQKEEAEPSKKKKSRAQRKIEKLIRENRRLREMSQTQGATKADEPEQADAISDIEINIDDFETYDEYLEALEARENNEEVEVEDPVEVEELDQEDLEIGYQVNEMMEDGEEDYENFRELVSAPDLVVTDGMLSDILDLESPSDIAYYLATHKEESARIAGMTRREQTKALIKIEVALENKPKKTVRTTNAPKPINPVGGSAAVSKSLNDNDLSYEEHEALLNSRKAAGRGGFL